MSQTSPVTETQEFLYARDLLVSFVEEHCDPVPEWKPNSDLMGILMQFDNALTVVRSIKAGFDPKQPAGHAQRPKQPLDFFTNVDAWGAAEWFDRMAKAIREQDAAVLAGDEMGMETYRNIAASSAMRLVRDYEKQVRTALSHSSTGRQSGPTPGFRLIEEPCEHHHCEFPSCGCEVPISSPDRCQVCGEPADLTCGPSRFGDKTWACKDCWEPDTRPDRKCK